ncbi:MAG: DUF1549 domain-containing protein, partial [Planctomycetota bacterium]
MARASLRIALALVSAVWLAGGNVFAGEALDGPPAGPGIVRPFEDDTVVIPANGIDTHVLAALRRRGIEPAPPCSDEVFVRRVYLDVIGTLP